MKRKIFLVFVFILVLIQFIRPKLNNKDDCDLTYFIEETNLNKHLFVIMKTLVLIVTQIKQITLGTRIFRLFPCGYKIILMKEKNI